MESNSRKMGAKKPQCTVLHHKQLASPSHCQVVTEKKIHNLPVHGEIHHNPISGNIADIPA